MTNKTPSLRFKGFNDNWGQSKLLNLLEQPITDGPHETPKLLEEGVPFISADAIVDNKIDFSRLRGYISEDYDLQCSKKYKPLLHDVYMVKSGSTTGKVAIVETTKRFNIWSPLAAMRCNKGTDPYFLFFLLQTNFLQSQVSDKASHGTQPNLSMRQLEMFDVITPIQPEEKSSLGALFKSLNALIFLHQDKLEQLIEVKKTLLVKMFPESGFDVPSLRFKGFVDVWGQNTLNEISVIAKGQQLNKSDLSNEGTYYVLNGGMTPSGYTESYNTKANTISISEGGNSCGFVFFNEEDFWSGGHNYTLSSLKIDARYLYQNLKKQEAFIMSLRVGSGLPNVQKSRLGEVIVSYPQKLLEQKTIASFLTSMDTLISLHQQKLVLLKNLKSSLLNKMFPN